MPRAIQHQTTLNVPELGLVLDPGVSIPVTPKQAAALEKLGVTVVPDPATKPTKED